jgi:hypothetical protein
MGSDKRHNVAEDDSPDSSSGGRLGTDSSERALRAPEWAAQFLGVSVEWLVKAADRGELPCIRLEHHVRFDPVELKTWVRQQGSTWNRSGTAGNGHAADTPSTTIRPRSLAPLRRELRALRDDMGMQRQAAVPVLEAARRLGCSRARVFELLKRGELKRAPSFGKSTMVDVASIDALRERAENPTSTRARAPRAKRPSAATYGERIDELDK